MLRKLILTAYSLEKDLEIFVNRNQKASLPPGREKLAPGALHNH